MLPVLFFPLSEKQAVLFLLKLYQMAFNEPVRQSNIHFDIPIPKMINSSAHT